MARRSRGLSRRPWNVVVAARDERGIALVAALWLAVVLAIGAMTVSQIAGSNLRSTHRSVERLAATRFAESGVDAAIAFLSQQLANGGNPSAANLLGCAGAGGATDPAGPSNCTAPVPRTFCLGGTSCSAGAASTASVYGFYSGTSAASYGGTSVPASTWLLVSTGHAWNPAAERVDSHTLRAFVRISALGSGAIAAVWNHVFVTAPLTPGVCALDFQGNSVTVTVPLYVIGNLCLGSNGSGATVTETTQPIDLEVGGKLVLLGGSKIGADASHPITSGVVVGGCTTVGVGAATTPCSPASFPYWVRTSESFIQNDAPSKGTADIAADYASFDPGPQHPCAAGNNPYPPLASTVLDNNTVQDDSAGTFELTPTTSYSCVSQSGASVGQLSWNASTKQLAIAGKVFVDGNVTISQSATYTGTAVLETAGTITFTTNNLALCATSPCNTAPSAWQGSSGNDSMLTLVSLATNTNAVTFATNSQTFQGSLWVQPSSKVHFVKNGVTIDGPMSVGGFDSTFNNATLIPLPVIANMPVGAPLPPNSTASLSRPVYLSG